MLNNDNQVYLNVTTPTDTEGPVVPPHDDDDQGNSSNGSQNTDPTVISLDDEDVSIASKEQQEPLTPVRFHDDDHPHAHLSIPTGDPLDQDEKEEERNSMPASYPEVDEAEIMSKESETKDPADDDSGLSMQDYPTYKPTQEEVVTNDLPDENISEEVNEAMEEAVGEVMTEAVVQEEKEAEQELATKEKQVMQEVNLNADMPDVDGASIPSGASMGSMVEFLDDMQKTIGELKEKVEKLEKDLKDAKQKVA